MLHLVSGTNSIYLLVNLILVFLHFILTYSFTHHFVLFRFTTLLIHNYLSLSLPA